MCKHFTLKNEQRQQQQCPSRTLWTTPGRRTQTRACCNGNDNNNNNNCLQPLSTATTRELPSLGHLLVQSPTPKVVVNYFMTKGVTPWTTKATTRTPPPPPSTSELQLPLLALPGIYQGYQRICEKVQRINAIFYAIGKCISRNVSILEPSDYVN